MSPAYRRVVLKLSGEVLAGDQGYGIHLEVIQGMLWIAIGWHALVDAVGVYSAAILGMYVTELIIAVFALASLAFIFMLRQPEPELSVEPEPVPVQAPDSTVLLGQVSPIVTDDKLSESRFQ